MILPLYILLLLPGFGPAAAPAAPPDGPAGQTSLVHRKRALEMEIDLVRKNPQQFYLVLDLPAAQIHLKSGAFLLRSVPVRNIRPLEHTRETVLLELAAHIPPVTPEPGNSGLRLRGRRFPLDFSGRLVEGPRETSRLYFTPSLLLQPEGIESPPGVFALEVSGNDIKALGSALQPGDRAILIPPQPPQNEAPR